MGVGKKENRGAVYALFTIVVLGSACGNLSQTAINAMLVDIMGEFSMEVGLGQWLTTSYMLVLGITVPAATFLSTRCSTRQHVCIALVCFLVGAMVDLMAINFAMLLSGRILQAISTGLLMPLMQTIAMIRFPLGRQATAMGIGGIAMGFAPNIGPTIGGAMSFTWGWRSFFVLLVIITVMLAVATVIVIKPDQAIDKRARLDVISLTLSSLGFGGLLLGFSNASGFEAASPFIWAPLVLGVAFIALFVRRQKRVAHPLISMDIFKSSQFTTGFVALNLLSASFMGITLLVPLYVEELCGGTALEAGIVLLPGTVTALVMNPLSGVLTDRMGARPVVIVFATFLAVGSLLMSFLDASTPLWVTTLCQGVRAVGVSGLIGPITSWSLAELPHSIVPDGSSFGIAVRQACASFGTSVMVFAITVGGSSVAGMANPALPYQLAFGFSALLALSTLLYVVVKVR